MHSVQFMDPKPFTDKRIVIVGAGNTAIDIAQDLCNANAKEVTMVQRSSTWVVSSKFNTVELDTLFNEARPTYYNDLAFLGVPLGALREFGKSFYPLQQEFDKDLLDGLKKTKFKLNSERAGVYAMYVTRGGGKNLDYNCTFIDS